MLTEIIKELENLAVWAKNPDVDVAEFRLRVISTIDRLTRVLIVVNEKIDVVLNGKVTVIREDIHEILRKMELK